MWNILKEVSGNKDGADETYPDIVNPDVVDKFNTYFSSIGKQIQDELGVTFNFEHTINDTGFKFKEVNAECVVKLIDRIKAKIATGYDGIPSRILKDLKLEASVDLAKLINLSFRTCRPIP